MPNTDVFSTDTTPLGFTLSADKNQQDRIAALAFSLQAHICEEDTQVTIERAEAFLKFIQGKNDPAIDGLDV